MKIDTVYVERQATGNQISSFHILDLAEAKKEAANLTAYHQEPFVVVIKNEDRQPSVRKQVKLDKKAKALLGMIKTLHESVVTGQRYAY